MEYSDDDLRKQLANYMDNVPPVTGSTREVLKAKLAKFQSSQPKDVPSKSSIVNGDTAVDKRTSKRQTLAVTSAVTPAVKTTNAGDNADLMPSATLNSPDKRRDTSTVSAHLGSAEEAQAAVAQTPRTYERSPDLPPISSSFSNVSESHSPLSKFHNESILYEDEEYRVRYFPSSEMPDYPGGVPVFRRRSLHPLSDKASTSNPYEEFYIRSPRLQAKIDAERIISRVMSGSNSSHRSGTYRNIKQHEHWYQPKRRKTWLNMPSSQAMMKFFSGAFLGLFTILLTPFAAIRIASSRIRSAVGYKTLLALFLTCILVFSVVFFFFSDPFYRNPVAEFADRISGPLASILQVEN